MVSQIQFFAPFSKPSPSICCLGKETAPAAIKPADAIPIWYLRVAGATRVSASRPVRMTVCTGIAAIVAIILCYGVVDFYNANACVAGAFLLCDVRHVWLLIVWFDAVVVMREYVLNHDLQDTVHTGVGH